MDNPQRLQLKLSLFPFSFLFSFFFSCKAVVRNSARNMSPTKDIFFVYMFPVKQKEYAFQRRLFSNKLLCKSSVFFSKSSSLSTAITINRIETVKPSYLPWRKTKTQKRVSFQAATTVAIILSVCFPAPEIADLNLNSVHLGSSSPSQSSVIQREKKVVWVSGDKKEDLKRDLIKIQQHRHNTYTIQTYFNYLGLS